MDHRQWCYQRQQRLSQPDGTIEIHRGREWARIHPRICPVCESTFYGWMPIEAAWVPSVKEAAGKAVRETCGNPMCWVAEDERVFKLNHPALPECAQAANQTTPKPVPVKAKCI